MLRATNQQASSSGMTEDESDLFSSEEEGALIRGSGLSMVAIGSETLTASPSFNGVSLPP